MKTALLAAALLILAAPPLPCAAEAEARAAEPESFELWDEMADPDPEPEVAITFRSLAVVRGEEYTLGDLADVEAADPGRAARLEALVLGRSPRLGARTVLREDRLEASLHRLGIDSGERRVALTLPETVVVERDLQKVDLKPYRELIAQDLVDQVAGEEDPASFLVEGVSLPAEATLPAGTLDHAVEFRLPRRNAVGTVSWELKLLVDGAEAERFTGTLSLDREVEVWQSDRPFARGEPLSADALSAVSRRLSDLRRTPLSTGDLRDALTARRDIQVGDVLTWMNVERQVLVERNAVVRIFLTSEAGLRISTLAKATADGALGDTIFLENLKSGRRVQGTVVGKQQVRVAF